MKTNVNINYKELNEKELNMVNGGRAIPSYRDAIPFPVAGIVVIIGNDESSSCKKGFTPIA